MIRIGPLTASALAALLCACAVGPNYRTPVIAPAAKGAFLSAGEPAFSQAPPSGRWWRLFESSDLDALIEEALTTNSDLRVAAANLAQSRAVLQEARAGRFPSTALSLGANYNRVSQAAARAQAPRAAAGQAGAQGTIPDTWLYSAGLDVSYELDLFGRISRSIEASKRDSQAQAAALDFARTTVAAETARAFADACGFAQQLTAARRTVEVQASTYDLTLKLNRGGRLTALDAAQAASLLASARSVIPTLEGQRRAALFRLAVLTGKAPAQIDPAADRCAVVPKVAVPLPVGDGAALIRRRPDVRQAERALAGQTARIGVATAALYPSISLLGSVGASGPQPKDLVSGKGLSFSVGPLITWNFPNTLVARARIRQAQAGADAALATFDGVVLTALSESEQALTVYARELDRNDQLRIARDQAAIAARIARLRYTTGSDSFLTSLVSMSTLASAETSLAQSDVAVAQDQIAVFKALGGGWEDAPPVMRVAGYGR